MEHVMELSSTWSWNFPSTQALVQQVICGPYEAGRNNNKWAPAKCQPLFKALDMC